MDGVNGAIDGANSNLCCSVAAARTSTLIQLHAESDAMEKSMNATARKNNEIQEAAGREDDGENMEGIRVQQQQANNKVGKDEQRLKVERKKGVIRKYERMLSPQDWYARIIGVCYAASRFVGYFNLTWATVVLLGAFCSLLKPYDLWCVTALLVAEALRLATATFFSVVRSRSHSSLHQNHRHPDPRTLRLSYVAQHTIRFLSIIVQYGISAAVFIISKHRIVHIHPNYSQFVDDTARNLPSALLLFYRLLIANSILNIFTIFLDTSFSTLFFLRKRLQLLHIVERSFIRYYEHVVEKLLRGRLSLADPVDFFHFAYVDVLGREFEHNVNAKLVVKEYGRMLEYLYAHPQGFDHLFVYLQHDDPSVQQAAANVPGLWMLHPETRDMVESLPEGLVTRLLWRLPDIMGEVGWAAVNSLGAIAANGKGDLLLSFGTKVGDALAAAVDPRTSCSLVLVRAMVFLVHGQVKKLPSPPMASPQDPVVSKIFTAPIREKLEKDLESLLRDADVHRLRALSAYLLFLLGRDPTHIHLPDAHPFLGITLTSDDYWLSTEKEMLEQLYDQFTTTGRSAISSRFPKDDERKEDVELTVPEWARPVS